MIQEIKNGIAEKLYDAYEYGIFFDELEQGFTAPCFWVVNTSVIHTHVVNRRYMQVNNFDIHYFPENPADTSELEAVAEVLTFALEYINAGDGQLRGENMSYEIQDGVLHFNVTYRNWIWKLKEEVPKMQTLTQIQKVKEWTK